MDDDRDGLVDRIEIGIQLPLLDSETITRLEALIFHEVRFENKAKVKFDALSHLHYTSGGVPMGQLQMDGNVIVKQFWPLRVKGG
jgi:hypothetical protein